MKALLLLALALPLAGALSSCGSHSSSAAPSDSVTPPTDTASSEQRKALDETVSEIEVLSSELGHAQGFRSLPMVVSEDTQFTDHLAACVSVNGKPSFIVIKPNVFAMEKRFQQSAHDATLFRVVLHEIGHCYFHREHEETHLMADEGESVLEFSAEDKPNAMTYPTLDASVMVPENLVLPIPLKKYYVAELLGLARAKSLGEIATFAKSAHLAHRVKLESATASK